MMKTGRDKRSDEINDILSHWFYSMLVFHRENGHIEYGYSIWWIEERIGGRSVLSRLLLYCYSGNHETDAEKRGWESSWEIVGGIISGIRQQDRRVFLPKTGRQDCTYKGWRRYCTVLHFVILYRQFRCYSGEGSRLKKINSEESVFLSRGWCVCL